MLLDFKMKNFRAFYEKASLTMFADTKKKDNQECLISEKCGNISRKILPSAVIYGANASGKTTIIDALNLMKQIVVNGTIKKQVKNNAISKMDIDTFIHIKDKSQEPIYLDVTFKAEKNIYNYILEILCSYNIPERRILREELNLINYKKDGNSIIEVKENVFLRSESNISLKGFFKLEKEEYTDIIKDIEDKLSLNIDSQDLFLTTGFKSMISLEFANEVINWFQDKLITIVDFTGSKRIVTFVDDNSDESIDMVKVNPSIDKLVEIADFGPQKLGYAKDSKSGNYSLHSFYKVEGQDMGIKIPSDDVESKGTLKLLDFWVGFLEYFNEGGIFVLDEFDCSIHPEIIGGIIDLFNNPDINKSGAQLIFNTHNPLYLQKRFFRRDQILFVEKDRDTYMSKIYKLSDFNIRSDLDYMKNYFEGKFGALPYMDFESTL